MATFTTKRKQPQQQMVANVVIKENGQMYLTQHHALKWNLIQGITPPKHAPPHLQTVQCVAQKESGQMGLIQLGVRQ